MTREQIAEAIAEALRNLPCSKPAEGWNPAIVTVTETTSGCPVIQLDLYGAGKFNITITRARG